MEDETSEERLQERQDGRVYPLGRALRTTFDADNHDTLGSDVTGLMIDLSRVPYGPATANTPFAAPLPPAPPPVVARGGASFLARLGGLFGRR